MKISEIIGVPMHHTAKAMGLKRVRKGGRTYYQPINKDPRRGEGNQLLIKDSFADGKKPGRKGLSKRVGVSQKMSISQLKKIAKTATGERKRMAQWNLNMKRGRARKK
jgi:hypothetical protein